MVIHRGPQLDMTPDGEFRAPPRPPILFRIGAVALLVAVIGALAAGALLALWFALILIPIALGAGVIAWIALRLQLWRGGSSLGRKRDVFRP